MAQPLPPAIASMAAKPRMPPRDVEGWLIEEMIPPGREIVIGGFSDPQFGPMIMVGLGGVLVEVLEDVAFRICPLTRAEAADMLADRRRAHACSTARAVSAAVDKTALIDVMLRIGGENGLLMSLADEIAEADLNPVIVNENGVVAADARFILADRADAPQVGTDSAARPHAFDAISPLVRAENDCGARRFDPRRRDRQHLHSAAARPSAFLARSIRSIQTPAPIEGLQAYPSLAIPPQSVDYAYVAIGAERIPAAIAEAKGRCRIAQVISSGFGEVSEGKALEQQLVEQARIAGVRILGPNMLGAYSPRGGLTFPEDAPKEVGTIGIVAQSGGLSTDIIKRGQWRGLRLSGLMTIGNSADVTPAELVAYYLADPQTKAIGLYIEDIKGGRAFFELMRSAQATKPVVILRGGATGQGRAAALSHTGALAGEGRAWDALAAQTPVALVDTVEMFLDSLARAAMSRRSIRTSRPDP